MIRQVEKQDKEAWYALDKHLPESEFDEKVRCGQGYGMLMTSTQVDEDAQHFYRKLGYKDCGGFVIDVPGYEQPMEMIMIKEV